MLRTHKIVQEVRLRVEAFDKRLRPALEGLLDAATAGSPAILFPARQAASVHCL